MSDPTLLGPWVRRFLLDHVVAERNLARNTQQGYRDALGLLIPFVARQRRRPPDINEFINISTFSSAGVDFFLDTANRV